MRKFARDLEFSPSGLCEILKGRKKLSEDSTMRVIARLRLKAKEADFFDQICSYERCRSPELKALLQDQLGQRQKKRVIVDLSVDRFRMLSDWQHSAILAASEMSEGLSVQKAAKLFKMTVQEASQAVDRLERLGLVKIDLDDRVIALANDLQVTTKVPNEALQKFTKQILQKADESQTEQTNQERVFGTETLAFDERDLPQLRELTDDYFEAVIQLAKNGKQKNQVYSVGVQAFRLNKKENL